MPADSLKRELTDQLLNSEQIDHSTIKKLRNPSAETLQLIEDFLTGELIGQEPVTYSEQMFFLGYDWFFLLERLFEHNRLTEELLSRMIYRHCGHIMWRLRNVSLFPQEDISDSFRSYFNTLLDNFMWKAAQELSATNCQILQFFMQFEGSRYLLLAAQHVISHRITRLKAAPEFITMRASPAHIVALLAETTAADIDTESKRQAVIEQLRRIGGGSPPSSEGDPALAVLLPVAKHYRPLLCEVLGWEAAVPLVSLLEETAEQSRERTPGRQPIDIPNSPDPSSGTLDAAAARQAVQLAGNELAEKILSLIQDSGAFGANVAFLIQAVLGTNRPVVESKFQNHTQLAIKAYGLLPLAGDETILQRYLALKKSAKEGQKFGQARRPTHAGAVRAALENLAQVGGFADATRLELAMEAELAEEVAAPGRRWSVEDYELELQVEGVDVSIAVYRSGRQLKSVPQGVRASDAYKEAKEVVEQFRSQVRRLRQGLLEGLISTGETISRSDFETLMRLPVARDLCQRLIWKTGGAAGLPDIDRMVVVDLEGRSFPVGDTLSLVHSYDLFQESTLAAWQREIVRQRVVQPIKQAYRELYIVTPAELETGTYSNRFAGHVIDGGVAAGLLTGRGWGIESADVVTPYKIIGGIRAVFELDAQHYLGRQTPVVTDKIFFQPASSGKHGFWNWGGRDSNWIPLSDVPPLVFSEIMRDADLVVSVSQREGEARISNETFEQRGSLITALLDDLGLPGVTVQGHFAYVEGRLAQYRVHLGSAVIHIEPGNYLCIVPDRWGKKHEKLFLPFADERDSKISEVISKILYLLADDKIKDETVLQQLRHQTRT